MDHYLRVNELQAKLKVSRATMYRLMAKGLPSVKVGSARRFLWRAVEAWLEGQDVPTDGVLLPGHYRCQECGGVNRIVHPALRRLLCCWQCGRGPLNAVALGETG